MLDGRQFQTSVKGVEHQFQAVGNPELIVDCAQVIFHGLLSDREMLSDLSVSAAECHVADDRLLPRGQSIRRPNGGLSGVFQRLDHLGDILFGQPDFIVRNLAGALDEKARVDRLENHPGGAGLHVAQCFFFGHGGRGDDDLAPGRGAPHPSDQVARSLGYDFQVYKKDVRLERL